MEITRIFDILEKYRYDYKDKADALACKENGKWTKTPPSNMLKYQNMKAWDCWPSA